MLTGNKGEWSEVYTLLKVLSDKKLFAGNGELTKIKDLIFPIIRVLRDESTGTYSYSYEDDIVIVAKDEEEYRIPVIDFHHQATHLLHVLRESAETTFNVPEIEEFINSFNCGSLKARSSIKSDIRIVIHDPRTGTNPELGFSIKSQLGGASTLLNAGKTTNFVFEITGADFSTEQVMEVNSIKTHRKIMDRIQLIRELKGVFNFVGCENSTFINNLILIDSSLPRILAELVYNYYSTQDTKLTDLLRSLEKTNPLEYNLNEGHPFYSYKLKRLLTDIALGMMPSTIWTGELDATGGYLVVKENGDVLCYHVYNRNEFENYLLNHTKLETASSSRHDFGVLYSTNDRFYFKLNLQIRFLN